MELPKISIVTPSYNQSKFLEETILSVLNQDYPNLEYIIIDGGSTDGSVEIIQKYSDRLIYWVSEKDHGQSHAINKGFKRCSGEIVAWINSDDVYLPGIFRMVAEFFVHHPDIGMVYGDAELINQDGKLLKHKKEIPYDRTMGCLVGWGFIISQPTVFLRKEIFDRVGFLNEEFNYALDAEFWMRISNEFQVQHVSKTLARVRYHSTAKSISLIKQDVRCRQEMDFVQEKSYGCLKISRWLPYRYALPIRLIYRAKRIWLRLIRGHYFRKYIPESIIRRVYSP